MERILKKIIFPFVAIYLFIKSWIIYKYFSFKYRNTDYFEYKKLADPRFLMPKYFTSVCHFGNYKAISRLKKSPFNFFTEYIEHGMSFVDDVVTVELMGYFNRPFIRKVYTFSEKRKKTLERYALEKKLKRKIIPVGPYILGAKKFKSEQELDQLRKKYGKILLVMPHHSMEAAKWKYDNTALLNEIKRIKTDFDTVFICMFWQNIVDGEDTSCYENEGFKIVSAGHRSDPKFLSRLKDLMLLSSMTMSNAVGTHIGYSISLGRPHYLFHQQIAMETNSAVYKDFFIKVGDENRKAWEEFYDKFGEYSFRITEDQTELIRKFWGEW